MREGKEDGNGKRGKGYAPKLGLRYPDTPTRSLWYDLVLG